MLPHRELSLVLANTVLTATNFHKALDLPLVNRRIADPILAKQVDNGNPALVFRSNAYDLFLGESDALHLWPFRLGQILSPSELVEGGNVSLFKSTTMRNYLHRPS